jgi:hypothetical protein
MQGGTPLPLRESAADEVSLTQPRPPTDDAIRIAEASEQAPPPSEPSTAPAEPDATGAFYVGESYIGDSDDPPIPPRGGIGRATSVSDEGEALRAIIDLNSREDFPSALQIEARIEDSGPAVLSPGEATLGLVGGPNEVVASASGNDRVKALLAAVEDTLPLLHKLARDLEAEADVTLKSEGRLVRLVVTPACVSFSVEIREIESADLQRSLARMLKATIVGTANLATHPRTTGVLAVLVSALNAYLDH